MAPSAAQFSVSRRSDGASFLSNSYLGPSSFLSKFPMWETMDGVPSRHEENASLAFERSLVF